MVASRIEAKCAELVYVVWGATQPTEGRDGSAP